MKFPKVKSDVTNFDVIYRAAKHLEYTKEFSYLNKLTPVELLTAVTSLRASKYDLFLDQLTSPELKLAVKGDVRALNASLRRREDEL